MLRCYGQHWLQKVLCVLYQNHFSSIDLNWLTNLYLIVWQLTASVNAILHHSIKILHQLVVILLWNCSQPESGIWVSTSPTSSSSSSYQVEQLTLGWYYLVSSWRTKLPVRHWRSRSWDASEWFAISDIKDQSRQFIAFTLSHWQLNWNHLRLLLWYRL